MKRFSILYTTTLTAFLLSSCSASAADGRPVACWVFDGNDNSVASEEVSGSKDSITGYAEHVKGVRGAALKLGGFTTHVTHKADSLPRLADSFTVQAWVAPQTYSWNWTGIVDREKDYREGFSFGIDHMGRVGLGVAIDGKWDGLISKESISRLSSRTGAITQPPWFLTANPCHEGKSSESAIVADSRQWTLLHG